MDATFVQEFAAAAEADFAFGLVVVVGVNEEFAVAAQGDVAGARRVVEGVLVVVVDLVGEVGLVEGDGVGAYFGVGGDAARLVDGEVFGAFEGVVDGDGFAAGTRASAGLAEVDGVVARAEVQALESKWSKFCWLLVRLPMPAR